MTFVHFQEQEAARAQAEMEEKMREVREKEEEAKRLQEQLRRTQEEMEEKQRALQEAINTPRVLHVSEHDDDDEEKGIKSRVASTILLFALLTVHLNLTLKMAIHEFMFYTRGDVF